jgi:hypothetical protein
MTTIKTPHYTATHTRAITICNLDMYASVTIFSIAVDTKRCGVIYATPPTRNITWVEEAMLA